MDSSTDHGDLGAIRENYKARLIRNGATFVGRYRIKALRRETVSHKQMILAVTKGFLFELLIPENGLPPNNKVRVIGHSAICNRTSPALLSFCNGDG